MGLRVAITGGIACGKSLFASVWRQLGADVVDADDVVHRLEAPGGAAVEPIRALFGAGVLRPDGAVDRAELGRRVFADAAARERLNRAVHPLVRQALREWLAQPGARLKAAVIPLLFEAGWSDGWDAVICLASGEEEQVRRLVRNRGMTPEEARARIAAQMPLAEKAARSDWVVKNEADAAALALEAERLFRLLMERT